MRYKTHVVTSVSGAAIAANLLAIPFTFGYVTGVVVGSLLPDIDEPKSYVGRRASLISRVIKGVFGHRGITHSLLAWFLTFAVYFLYPTTFTLGLSLGYFFHILGDYFSVKGVPLFAPLSKKHQKALITYRTSSKGESTIFIISCIFIVAFLFHYSTATSTLVASTLDFLHQILELIGKTMN